MSLEGLPGGANWHFFTTPKASLGKRTPLQALAADRLADVKIAAEGYAERCAACGPGPARQKARLWTMEF